MDTRRKIVNEDAALEVARATAGKLTVVVGTFDVVLAAHARGLDQGRHPLMVVLAPAAVPLLGERARAELVAALHMVDYVVIPGATEIEPFVRRLGADQVIWRQAADEQEQRRLIEHVQRRHNR